MVVTVGIAIAVAYVGNIFSEKVSFVYNTVMDPVPQWHHYEPPCPLTRALLQLSGQAQRYFAFDLDCFWYHRMRCVVRFRKQLRLCPAYGKRIVPRSV